MRIVQIGGTYIGAQQGIETSIHNYLCTHGEDSYILYAIGDSDDTTIIKYENKTMSVIRRVLAKVTCNNPHSSIISTLRAISLIERINPTLVHLHILHHGYLDYILLLRYLGKKKIPVVYTMHDMWAFTGGCYYYSSIGCDKLKYNCSNCSMERSKLDCPARNTQHYLVLKKQLFANLANISFVSVSDWVYKEFNQSLLRCYYSTVIWNGIDVKSIQELRTLEYDATNRKFRIISVANNWGDRKGISKFIELSKMLDERFEIVLIGNVDQQYKQHADKKIIFFGPIKDKAELYNQYKCADINVSLSSEETFGMTFLESALVGTKSIGLNNTAVPQILEKLDGFVVDDYNDVFNLLNQLVFDRSSCKLDDEMISNIQHEFSSEYMAQRYYELYENQISHVIGDIN